VTAATAANKANSHNFLRRGGLAAASLVKSLGERRNSSEALCELSGMNIPQHWAVTVWSNSPQCVTDILMAMDTERHFAAGIRRHHLVHGRGMAIDASVLGDAAVSRLDSNRLVKILERERQRVEKPVIGLGDPMTNEVVWQMAIIAGGDVAVAGMLPGIVVPLHDMTVRARFGVAAQIAGAFAIAERKQSDAKQQAEQHGQYGGNKRRAIKGSNA
jgi:hypothetical protein